MDSRTRTLNKHLRAYDRDLYAERFESGVIHIFRKVTTWVHFELNGTKFGYAKTTPLFIIALTDNWLLTGNPVQWGIEPLMSKIRDMDNWREDSTYTNIVKEREQLQRNQERSARNNVRALAADMRRDFARATNDINTSTLKKIEKRRLKDGYCK